MSHVINRDGGRPVAVPVAGGRSPVTGGSGGRWAGGWWRDGRAGGSASSTDGSLARSFPSLLLDLDVRTGFNQLTGDILPNVGWRRH